MLQAARPNTDVSPSQETNFPENTRFARFSRMIGNIGDSFSLAAGPIMATGIVHAVGQTCSSDYSRFTRRGPSGIAIVFSGLVFRVLGNELVYTYGSHLTGRKITAVPPVSQNQTRSNEPASNLGGELG